MELNRATMKKIMLLIAFAVLLLVGVQRFETLVRAARFLLGVTAPFLAGGAIAFVINVPMHFLEEKLFGGIKKKRGKSPGYVRPLSLLLTLVLVVLVILVLMLVIIPQLTLSVIGLGSTISAAITHGIAWGQEMFANNPEIMEWLNDLALDWRNFDWQGILNTVMDILKTGFADVLSSTISAVGAVVSGVFDAFIAIIFAFYILLQKEKLGVQGRKILFALLPQRHARRTIEVVSLCYRTFASFISGQCLEAVILGTMFFIAMSITGMPYALLVSCLISVTALIPIVGAFIGCGVGVFLILMVSPIQALIFLIMFLVLQQVEGNLIYPHVVGSSVGLPAIWVLMAVTVGGSLMGVVGMLIFIPITSVIYTLFRGYVNRRLEEKKIQVK